jgi:DNA-binding PucR family transcriptional regulator
MPELYPDAETSELTRASIEATLRTVATVLRDRLDPATVELPLETIANAREGARQGLPIAGLLRTYRIGHAMLWELMVAELTTRASSMTELGLALQRCAAVMFGYVDAAVELAEREYATERERFARSSAALRAETIASILEERLTDAQLAGQRLRHELNRTHVGAWAWLARAPVRGDPYELLEAALVELGQAAGVGTPLMQPLGTHAVAGWLSGPSGVDMERLAVVRLDATAYPDVMVAVGEPAVGIEGFRATHTQASSARRVATITRRPPGPVTRFATVELQAIVSASLDQVREFVQRELGPLAASDDATARLAATLRAYLDEHASRSRAAVRLGVHENTIRYRIRQVEELLGRSVEDDTLNLRVALAVAPLVRDPI